MIAGIDIRIPTRLGTASVEVAVRVIKQVWPHAVFENGLTGERYHRFQQIPFGKIEEIFVYRDRASADVWDEEGAVPAASNSMIHVIADEDMVTLVVDENTNEMIEIINSVETALSDVLLKVPARTPLSVPGSPGTDP